ncbi:hypothetical protein AB3662_11925 [Sorangium cellulosum]|uniref:hypothetical protein n=1 Tax=Sorangium cellulosum TaxID=56 RepID=UPI003D9A429B
MAARLVTKKLNGSVVPPPVELLLAVAEPPLVAEPPPLVAEPPPLVAEPPPLVAEPPPLVAEPPEVAEPPPVVAAPPELDDASDAPSLEAPRSPLEQPSTGEDSAMVRGSHRER